MNTIRLLTYWQYGINTQEFEFFIKENNIEFCAYLYENKSDILTGKMYDPIYLYNSLEYFKSNISNDYVIDESIIIPMRNYELTAMDIIYRWRKSISYRDDYKTIRTIYFIYLRFWAKYIQSNKINLLIINTIPHIPSEYFPYAICKILNIPTIIQGTLPFIAGEKINYILKPTIEDIDFHFKERLNKELQDNSQCNDLPLYLSRYFEQFESGNLKKFRVIFYNEKRRLVGIVLKYLERGWIYLKRFEGLLLINKIINLIKIKIFNRYTLKRIEKYEKEIDYSNKFYFFPLHLQPEASTLPRGGIYVDQLLIVKMIAKNLPSGIKLYVKEHPSYWIMKGRLESISESRTKYFYDQIDRLENVILIKHTEDSMKLINECQCLVTVSGTAGFEALFMSKPVLLFGESFYQHHKDVFKIHTEKDLTQAIQKISNINFNFDRNYMLAYMRALKKYVVPLGAREQNHLDNGTPPIDETDRQLITNALTEFIQEYYSDSYDVK